MKSLLLMALIICTVLVGSKYHKCYKTTYERTAPINNYTVRILESGKNYRVQATTSKPTGGVITTYGEGPSLNTAIEHAIQVR